MELITITQVSKDFNISTRTLRYYEKLGILESTKVEDYAYRTYDENALRRLQHILILRKLRIPLRQIKHILQYNNTAAAIEAFQENVKELDDEITAQSTIKILLQTLIDYLRETTKVTTALDQISDETIIHAIDSLSLSKIHFKEEKSMEKINKLNKDLGKLQDRDVRIVYLPPATVAAAHYIGDNPEENCGEILQKFVKDSGLYHIKKDARVFGFNHPNPRKDEPYGYEIWVTIPNDMEIPDPLVKKTFQGGLYAAHKINLGDFHEWQWLCDWVKDNTKFDDNALDDGGECMHGLLEEHLNHLYWMHLDWPQDAPSQLDLLYPIKPKESFK